MNKINIVVAVTGASGAIYAKLLLEKLSFLQKQVNRVALVFSDTAKEVWKHEIGDTSYNSYGFEQFEPDNFYAAFASGSSDFDTMIVCPCTVGTMARIASGTAENLICRTADVMLKERRKLILVIRETPFSLIHIENMRTITLAGGVICPANPSYYSKPNTIEELAETVIDRVLNLANLNINSFQWMQSNIKSKN